MEFAELEPKAAEAEAFLKVMANRHRLMILCELIGEEKSVSALQERLGLGQSALSQHLARLRDERIVRTRRESQAIFYSMKSEHVEKIMALLHDVYCRDPQTIAADPDPTEESPE